MDKMNKRLITLCTATLLSFGVVAPLTSHVAKQVEAFMEMKTNEKAEEVKVNLLFPIKGETVDILKPQISAYISAMHEQAKDIEDDQVLHTFYAMAPDSGTSDRHYGETFTTPTDNVRISDYATNSVYMQRSKNVMLTFTAKTHTPDKVKVSLKQDMSDAVELTDITATESAYYVGVNQLLANKTYYWQVFENGQAISTVESFKTAEGFRMITTNSVTNVRDMGGRVVHLKTGVDENGKNVYNTKHIKQGLIFRGGELVEETYTPEGTSTAHTATLTTGDAEFLVNELGIGYEIDFRDTAESGNLTESPLKSYFRKHYETEKDINYLRLDNMSAYDDFFSITSSKSYYSNIKNMFKAFANAGNKHVYFHCWGGADRTGTAGFLLGALLGMDLTDLIIDYELTSFSCNYRPHDTNDAKKVYRFPSMLRRVMDLTTKADKNKTYYEPNKPIAQIIEEILIDRFEVTAEDIANIRSNLLED